MEKIYNRKNEMCRVRKRNARVVLKTRCEGYLTHI